jgi:hypothetical protein
MPHFIRTMVASSVRGTPEVDHFIATCTDKILKRKIDATLTDLKADMTLGDHLPKTHWPTYYVEKWGINNLYKKDLGRDWRLTYTLVFEGSGVGVFILEILNHREYNKRFGYRSS